MRREYADVVLDAAIVSFAAVMFAAAVLGMAKQGITVEFVFMAIFSVACGCYGWRGFLDGVRKIKAENRGKKAHQAG